MLESSAQTLISFRDCTLDCGEIPLWREDWWIELLAKICKRNRRHHPGHQCFLKRLFPMIIFAIKSYWAALWQSLEKLSHYWTDHRQWRSWNLICHFSSCIVLCVKHCQRHNRPGLLSLKLGWFLQRIPPCAPSCHRHHTCPPPSTIYTVANMITSINTPCNSCTTFPTPLVTSPPIMCISLLISTVHILLRIYLHHQLVLSCHYHQPESHQQSFNNVLEWAVKALGSG